MGASSCCGGGGGGCCAGGMVTGEGYKPGLANEAGGWCGCSPGHEGKKEGGYEQLLLKPKGTGKRIPLLRISAPLLKRDSSAGASLCNAPW